MARTGVSNTHFQDSSWKGLYIYINTLFEFFSQQLDLTHMNIMAAATTNPVALIEKCKNVGLFSKPISDIAKKLAMRKRLLLQNKKVSSTTKRTTICPIRGERRVRTLTPTLNKVKTHCKHCLNDNLVSTSAMSPIVDKLLTSTCLVCGMLWTDIKEDKQAHSDKHMKASIQHKSDIVRASHSHHKRIQTERESTALRLFHNDLWSRPAHDKIDRPKSHCKQYKSFKNMPHSLREIYMKKTMADMTSEIKATKRIEADKRPHLPVKSTVPFFFDPTNVFLTLEDIYSYRALASNVINEFEQMQRNHTIYKVDPELHTDMNWGSDIYVCALCREQLTVDCEGCILLGTRLCSCTADMMAKRQYPGEGNMSTEQLPLGEDCKAKKFLVFNSNVDYSAYVVHRECCQSTNPVSKENR